MEGSRRRCCLALVVAAAWRVMRVFMLVAVVLWGVFVGGEGELGVLWLEMGR